MSSNESSPASRDNNFDILRHIAAVFVLITHSEDLLHASGETIPFPCFPGLGFSAIGLAIFFTTSGFLVSASALRSASAVEFGKRRLLRIGPGLAFVIVFSTFVLGPIFSTLSLPQYFESPHSWEYLAGLSIFLLRWKLPGVWADNSNGINGSLWTIPIECTMYAVTWVLRKVRCLTSPWKMGTLLVAVLVARFAVPDTPRYQTARILLMSVPAMNHFAILYLAGAFLRELNVRKRVLLCTLILSIAGHMAFTRQTPWSPFTYVALPSLVILAARVPVPSGLRRLFARADISYGIYIFAFPVQQAIIAIRRPNEPTPWQLTAMALLMVIPIAYASWTIIEKPALRLVRKFPQGQ